jgi:hypothetical protein
VIEQAVQLGPVPTAARGDLLKDALTPGRIEGSVSVRAKPTVTSNSDDAQKCKTVAFRPGAIRLPKNRLWREC